MNIPSVGTTFWQPSATCYLETVPRNFTTHLFLVKMKICSGNTYSSEGNFSYRGNSVKSPTFFWFDYYNQPT